MIEYDFVLTTRQFDILWQDLGLGRVPYPLDVPSAGGTLAERAEIRAEVYRELAEHGLARDTRPDPDLAALLELLDQHAVAVDAVGYLEVPLRALAAGTAHQGVLAVLVGEEVGLLSIRPTSLAHSIVAVLPDRAAGPGHGMSLAHRVLLDAVDPEPADDEDDPWGGAEVTARDVLVRGGLSPDDAGALTELADSRVAGGQFGVSVPTGAGRADRMGTLVSWFDTAEGRYLMVLQDDWLSVAPADNARIEHRLAQVLP